MPKFNITLTRQLEQSVTIPIDAIDDSDANDKMEDLIDNSNWHAITQAYDVDDVHEEITVEDIMEA